jgi:hypothetical protein
MKQIFQKRCLSGKLYAAEFALTRQLSQSVTVFFSVWTFEGDYEI